MKGGSRVILDSNGRLLGFNEKLAGSANAEGVIGRFGDTSNLNGILVNHIFICFGITFEIVDIPAKRFKEWINELAAHLGLGVGTGFVCFKVAFEAFNKVVDYLRSWIDTHLTPD